MCINSCICLSLHSCYYLQFQLILINMKSHEIHCHNVAELFCKHICVIVKAELFELHVNRPNYVTSQLFAVVVLLCEKAVTFMIGIT